MNRKSLLAVFVLATWAISPLPAADPLPIALVNIDRLLKDYKPLNDKLDPLKAEAKEVENAIQVRQAELETVGNQLRQVLPGSPDQQRLQIQLVKMQGDFQRFVAESRNKLQNKEATTYLAFFRQLDAEISKYSKANGLKLVLRQSTTSLDDGQSLQDVFKALNRQIFYEDGIDITDPILKALQSTTAEAPKGR
ncbi:MAG TPA: OmpH family outer membrane protein [Pirellulaceae bacterium]|jgi:Skp family chaperone for outer membrane proteins